MLETIDQYAVDRLRESDDEARWRSRHFSWVLALAEEAFPALVGPQQSFWIDWMAGEIDNVRAALQWSIDEKLVDGFRIAPRLASWWVRRAPSPKLASGFLDCSTRLRTIVRRATEQERWMPSAISPLAKPTLLRPSDCFVKATRFSRHLVMYEGRRTSGRQFARVIAADDCPSKRAIAPSHGSPLEPGPAVVQTSRATVVRWCQWTSSPWSKRMIDH
jgi:hypothetical protein